MFQALARYFVRGLLVIVPIAITAYVLVLAFTAIDGWINVGGLLDRRIPGAGVAVTLVLIVLTGFLAGNAITRWVFRAADEALSRLPIVKLLYKSLKDLVGAFVGNQRKFERPVRFRPAEAGDVELLGFLTRDGLVGIGLPDHVAIYVPMAYNLGGAVMVVPRARVVELPLTGAAAMTFILSGGVSGGEAAEPV